MKYILVILLVGISSVNLHAIPRKIDGDTEQGEESRGSLPLNSLPDNVTWAPENYIPFSQSFQRSIQKLQARLQNSLDSEKDELKELLREKLTRFFTILHKSDQKRFPLSAISKSFYHTFSGLCEADQSYQTRFNSPSLLIEMMDTNSKVLIYRIRRVPSFYCFKLEFLPWLLNKMRSYQSLPLENSFSFLDIILDYYLDILESNKDLNRATQLILENFSLLSSFANSCFNYNNHPLRNNYIVIASQFYERCFQGLILCPELTHDFIFQLSKQAPSCKYLSLEHLQLLQKLVYISSRKIILEKDAYIPLLYLTKTLFSEILDSPKSLNKIETNSSSELLQFVVLNYIREILPKIIVYLESSMTSCEEAEEEPLPQTESSKPKKKLKKKKKGNKRKKHPSAPESPATAGSDPAAAVREESLPPCEEQLFPPSSDEMQPLINDETSSSSGDHSDDPSPSAASGQTKRLKRTVSYKERKRAEDERRALARRESRRLIAQQWNPQDPFSSLPGILRRPMGVVASAARTIFNISEHIRNQVESHSAAEVREFQIEEGPDYQNSVLVLDEAIRNRFLRKIQGWQDEFKHSPMKGRGKPEYLEHMKIWSRRLDKKYRLEYVILDGVVTLLRVSDHYK